MAYYMRKIVVAEQPTLEALLQRAQKRLPSVSFVRSHPEKLLADVAIDEDVVAELEVNFPSEELFLEERDELLEMAQDGDGDLRTVTSTLKASTAIVALRLLFGSDGIEAYMERINPFIDSLMMDWSGLLQDDDNGFFDTEENLILSTG